MKKSIFILSLAGLIFSGYMSSVKLFTKTCALGESCPYFLGYPACYFGFAMYIVIFICTSLLLIDKLNPKKILNVISTFSFLGILFAGYFTVREMPVLFERGFSAYFFGLPTCAIGLVFYVAIFGLSLTKLLKKKSTTETQ